MSHAAETHARHRRPLLWRIARARARLFFCLLAGAAVGLLLPASWREVTRALVGWDVFATLYLLLSAEMMARSTPSSIRRRAQFQDEGRLVILVMTIATACASIGAIVAELGPVKNLEGFSKHAHISLAVLTVVLSWLFVHLTFALHYAHEYYFERATTPDRPAELRGGLIFPGAQQPGYMDFLYFAYVIGVASQTADVSTASTTMRAAALVQGVLAFFFNTAILALTVNIAAGFV
ncbi:putative membrane protein [Methylosinus sp. sav-2]|uniref:DUF1345 domain-containing protein n=1 Tax=Methylosinus sp. sav-2 TaxID=2485168 RepID=UPI00056681B2|nr:DUF1345 domain-containing protein [Methylosinus sp. sav-2]TDX65616.1 putative membrane protein [Methylosinus sp. sav-2]